MTKQRARFGLDCCLHSVLTVNFNADLRRSLLIQDLCANQSYRECSLISSHNNILLNLCPLNQLLVHGSIEAVLLRTPNSTYRSVRFIQPMFLCDVRIATESHRKRLGGSDGKVCKTSDFNTEGCSACIVFCSQPSSFCRLRLTGP